jgi:hypothetical protein
MSRLYTNVPRASLFEAINTLPIIRGWGDAPRMKHPAGWITGRIEAVEKFGRGVE